jgi:hypothetical protein
MYPRRFSSENAEEPRIRGSKHHAANANAFDLEEADEQWFHLPDTSPLIGARRILPLCAELVRGLRRGAGESLGASSGSLEDSSAADRQQRLPRRLRHVTIT